MSLRFAPDKLALLLALVPYLDEVGVVSVAEAAAHFRVTEDDIRAAVNLIAVSGIPSVDHVALDYDMFDIDWDAFLDEDVIVLTRSVVIDETPRLSRGESAALIAGLNVLAGLPGSAENDVLHGLLRKLAENGGDGHVVVETETLGQSRSLVLEAVNARRQLTFEYSSLDGRTESRRIDPVQIESDNSLWYVRGWDHSREALRVFRLDRMSELRVTDEPALFDDSGVSLPDSLFDEGANDFAVSLRVRRAGLPLLGDFVRHANIPKQGDPVDISVRVAHVHGLKRIVAAHPELMRVVAPASAVATVADWARAGLDTLDASGAAHTPVD
ncbi:MAG TPA: WYL domain-containing protein [Microbacteriaceae bacterium]|nr:WYL domain-containing protein [Microbacteriaceae bacterium]